MAFTALPQETWLPLAKAVERLVGMMADGQSQLQTKDRDNRVRGTASINQRMSGQMFSTDRVFLQQQQANHHNVDVSPDGAILE